MAYIINLLPESKRSERARGPARFIIEVSGRPQKKYGILFPDTARNLASYYPSYVEVAIRELTEREVMDYLMDGWGQGG